MQAEAAQEKLVKVRSEADVLHKMLEEHFCLRCCRRLTELDRTGAQVDDESDLESDYH